jgi:hypothetical protein
MKMGKILFCLALMFSLFITSASAHDLLSEGYSVAGTTGYDSSCSYPCDGYYADHFDAYFWYKSASTSQWYYYHADSTLITDNQTNDTWETEYVHILSNGNIVYSSTAHNGHKHTAPYGEHTDQWYPQVNVVKGNNAFWFHYEYILGGGAESWYPKRYNKNL